MKINTIYEIKAILFLIPFIAFIFLGCDQGNLPDESVESKNQSATKKMMKERIASSVNMQQKNKKGFVTLSGGGRVVSKATTDTYVFLELEEEGKRTWVSTISIEAKKGDRVDYKDGQIMSGFYSKSLGKTFDQIVFVDRVTINGKSPKLLSPPRRISTPNSGGPHIPNLGIPKGKTAGKIEIGSIKKLKGGFTIEELIRKGEGLDGKVVKVRGRVVKFLPGIMNKNWVHLQDGTGKEGANDLTVTTQDQTTVGNVVSITGKLTANKDFGGGYSYSLIIEDAKLINE